MARKVYEHRYEVQLIDRGPLKTKHNAIRFKGSDAKEFVRVAQPVIEKMFQGWVKESKAS